MSFRKSVQVLTESAGSYVQGIFTPGTRSVITIQASVQPMSGKDMVTAPEGRRIDDMIKVYADVELKQADTGTNQQPDLIVWRGYAYEVVSIDVRQMDVLPHYKIIAAKRMAVTDVNAWSAGTLNRG